MDSLGEGYGLDDLQAVLSGKKTHTPRKKIVTQAETQKVYAVLEEKAAAATAITMFFLGRSLRLKSA